MKISAKNFGFALVFVLSSFLQATDIPQPIIDMFQKNKLAGRQQPRHHLVIKKIKADINKSYNRAIDAMHNIKVKYNITGKKVLTLTAIAAVTTGGGLGLLSLLPQGAVEVLQAEPKKGLPRDELQQPVIEQPVVEKSNEETPKEDVEPLGENNSDSGALETVEPKEKDVAVDQQVAGESEDWVNRDSLLVGLLVTGVGVIGYTAVDAFLNALGSWTSF